MKPSIPANFLTVLTAATLLVLVSACSRLSNLDIQGPTMGTTWTVKVVDVGPQISSGQLQIEIQAILDGVNARMSTYQPDSELSRFNRSEPGEWFQVSHDTWFVVKRALEISQLSAGSFDVTVGPLVNLWGFGPDGRAAKVPTAEQVSGTLALVGYQQLKVSAKAPYALKKLAAVYVDLSAIAKGFAVDQVADYLEQVQIENYMVEVGGEVRVRGSLPSNHRWWTAEPFSAPCCPPIWVSQPQGTIETMLNWRGLATLTLLIHLQATR
jgi:thiamine biosynthesis lipoprotein